MNIKIKHRKSPLWYLWKVLFPAVDMKLVFIAFGDTIYCPRHEDPEPDLLEHETTHLKKQRYSKFMAVGFFILYRFLKSYRYRMELEAYRNQWGWIKAHRSLNTHELLTYHRRIAQLMSSPMYGKMCSYAQAFKALNEAEDA
jgi:hypothetical protein